MSSTTSSSTRGSMTLPSGIRVICFNVHDTIIDLNKALKAGHEAMKKSLLTQSMEGKQMVEAFDNFDDDFVAIVKRVRAESPPAFKDDFRKIRELALVHMAHQQQQQQQALAGTSCKDSTMVATTTTPLWILEAIDAWWSARSTSLTFFPGVQDALRHLRNDRGMKLITCSNSNSALPDEVADVFDAIVTPQDAGGALKPDKAIFEAVFKVTEVDDPSQVLFVGNSWHNDVLGSLNVGCYALHIAADERRKAPTGCCRSDLEMQQAHQEDVEKLMSDHQRQRFLGSVNSVAKIQMMD